MQPPKPKDTSKGIRSMIDALRGSPPQAPSSPAPAQGGPPPVSGETFVPPQPPPAPPSQPAPPSPPGSSGMQEFLMRRLEALEKALEAEGRKSAAAQARLQEKDRASREVEEELRASSEALRRERDASHARGRIESLESRLDQMSESWASMLKEVLTRLGAGSPAGEKGAAGAAGISERLEAIERTLSALARPPSPAPGAAASFLSLEERLAAVLEGQKAFVLAQARTERRLEELSGLAGRLESTQSSLRSRVEGVSSALASPAAALERTARELEESMRLTREKLRELSEARTQPAPEELATRLVESEREVQELRRALQEQGGTVRRLLAVLESQLKRG